MGNEASSGGGVPDIDLSKAQCCSCNRTDFSNSSSKPRKCFEMNCNLIYCGNCKKKFMYKQQKGIWYCAEHHLTRNNNSQQAGTKDKISLSPSITTDPNSNAFNPNSTGREIFNMAVNSPNIGAAYTPDTSEGIFPTDPTTLMEIDVINQTAAKSKYRSQPVSARHPAIKRETPPTPVMTPGTEQIYRMGSNDMKKKTVTEDNNGSAFNDNSSDTSKKPKYWTPAEDALLRSAVEEHGPKHWKNIATFVPGRSHVQCLQRWNKVLKPGLRKGTWSEREDATLTRLVNIMRPDVNWADVSASIPGRSAKQCRERWTFNLDPCIRRGDWTKEEDATLLMAQAEVGNKWAHISTLLPGRTENAIKTRYKSILRAKKKEWRPEEDAKLLDLYIKLEGRWDEMAEQLQPRTKNAVKTRYRFLTQGPIEATASSASQAVTKTEPKVSASAAVSAAAVYNFDQVKLPIQTATSASIPVLYGKSITPGSRKTPNGMPPEDFNVLLDELANMELPTPNQAIGLGLNTNLTPHGNPIHYSFSSGLTPLTGSNGSNNNGKMAAVNFYAPTGLTPNNQSPSAADLQQDFSFPRSSGFTPKADEIL